MIEEKKKGQKITAGKQPRKAPVVNSMEALKRSLERPRVHSPKAPATHPCPVNRPAATLLHSAEFTAP